MYGLEKIDIMEIQSLKNFLAVVNAGNITTAAKLINISQPTLSRQMTELEKELGAKLFERGSRRIRLTEAGLIYSQRAKESILLLSRAEREIHQSKIVAGDLYIGAAETLGMDIVADALKNLVTLYPAIRIHIYSGNADELNLKMQNGLLDFSIFINEYPRTNSFIRLPKHDTWGIIVNDDDPLATEDIIKPEMLKNKKFIISNQNNARSELESWLGYSLLDAQISASYNLIFNAAILVQKRIGIAVGINNLVEPTSMNGLVFKPFDSYLDSHIDIVWNESKELSEISAKFLIELKALI